MRILFFLFFPVICFCQEDNYSKLNKLPKSEFVEAVNDSIEKLNSGELWNFLKVLRDNYKTDLNPFNSSFINKMETCKWPMDMHFLLGFLIQQKTENLIIENIINNRKDVWDKGQWSEKFWKVIRENKLNIKESSNYSINDKGQKTYNIKLFLEEKIKNNEIGQNPLLFQNSKIVSYDENQILETLEKLNIKDIQIESKEKAPEVYGKRGLDGVIKILTNE